MKKAYAKPELLFESYELNTAGNCVAGYGNANASSPDQCSFTPKDNPFLVLFYESTQACEFDAPSAGFCYQNVGAMTGGSNNIFQS